jgi:hypothetical protein
MPKADNPSNVSQAHTLNFLGFARTVYAKGWDANNEVKLCGKIKRKLKEIDVSVLQTMMRAV